jgi:tetratricopeptide (TPR) repeat protein
MYREQYETAHRFSLEWLEVAQELGDASMVIGALQRLGAAAYAMGDIESARDHWDRALDVVRQHESRYAGGGILRSLGRLACLQGNYAAARALFEEALAGATTQNRDDVSHLANVGHALMGLGDVACGEGDLTEARAAYRESIAAWQQWVWTDALPKFGPRVRIACCLDGLAAVAAKEGQTARAAQWLSAAAALRESLDVHLPLPDAREWERWVERVRAALGEEAFEAAWEQGRRISFDEAVASAIAELPVG